MENDLVRRFAEMSDDALQQHFVSGQLDESALALLTAEFRRRGLHPAIPGDVADLGEGSDDAPIGFKPLVRGLAPLDAQILLGRLHAEGIDAHLSGANVTQTNPLWFQALGGVRIFVRTEQLAKARDVMNAADQGHYEVADAEEEDDSHVERMRKERLFGLIVVLLIAIVFGGIALGAIWSPSYDYFPYTMTLEPTSHIVGKWLFTIFLVMLTASWMYFVGIAVRRRNRS